MGMNHKIVKKKGIFNKNKTYDFRLFRDHKHFGFGIIFEKLSYVTQFTIHFGWYYFKIWKYLIKWQGSIAFGRAAYHYEQMLDELNKEPIRSLIGNKKLSMRLWNKIGLALLPKVKRNGRKK